MSQSFFPEFAAKMQSVGVSAAAQRAFQDNYEKLLAGASGQIPEAEIQPVETLPRLDTLPTPDDAASAACLRQTLVIKLNGGLGTGMGLEKAKSLLVVKDGLTFLDFIARHVLHLRETHRTPLPFLLMNSFSTSADTREFLQKYPALGAADQLELLQNRVPKVDAKTFRPVAWPADADLEWCPPGHGDLYPALLGSGWLDKLLATGIKYLFVSNADNLGASLDLRLLHYFATSDLGFLMEVCERTASDRKGGHLARRGSQLLLRELAQCPDADLPAFQDIARHRFFNTNNLWVRLDKLQALLKQHGGFLPLPLIKNSKTVDPREKNSPAVFQLETAMGAAIECFPQSGALVVPRSRFAPVKTTSDLLALRSDAYVITPDWRLELAPACQGVPPAIDLDGSHYKLVDQLDAKLSGGVPSLRQCRQLTVRGPVILQAGNIFQGNVTVTNATATPKPVKAGIIKDAQIEVS